MPERHQGNKAFVDAKAVEEIKQQLSIYFHVFGAHFQDHKFLDSLLICSSLLLLVLVGLSFKACCCKQDKDPKPNDQYSKKDSQAVSEQDSREPVSEPAASREQAESEQGAGSERARSKQDASSKPANDEEEEDETALEMSSVWRRFLDHLFLWAVWPLTMLGALLLLLTCKSDCSKKARKKIETSWKSITERLQEYFFQYLCIALLLTVINVVMVSYFVWNFHMDIDSKLVSPVEYYQAYLFNLLVLSLVVMSYTDKTFENVIVTRQEHVKKQSEEEEKRHNMKDKDKKKGQVLAPAQDSRSWPVDRWIHASPIVRLNTVNDVLHRLKRYYKTHFGGDLSMSTTSHVLSWLGPFVVMLIYCSIPRLWMRYFHDAPFLPRKETSTKVYEEDEFVIWVQSVLVHNWVVSVIGGTVFMHMFIICIAEFRRVKEQLLLLDALTTNGFDQLPPHDKMRLKEITYENYDIGRGDSYASYVPLVQDRMDMDVLIGTPSQDASPARKKRWKAVNEKAQEEKKTWELPLELQLSTPKGVRLWWRTRQWLSFDVRDERATMEMLLSFALFIVQIIFVGSFAWYVHVGQITLVVSLAFYVGCVLLVFVLASLNSCIEVNELMANDSLMLTNMRYYLAIETDHQFEEEVDKLLDILVVKIERLDEPQKVFGMAIDSALRTKFVSAIILSLGSTVGKALWQLLNGEGVFVEGVQQLFDNANVTNVTHIAKAMTGWSD